jgi:hypothetical protein
MRALLVASIPLVLEASASYAKGPESIPSDFALSVGFATENIAVEPGELVSWRTRIDSRGQAVQELYYLGPKKTVRKRPVFFSAQELQNLVAMLKKQRFFDLPEDLTNCEDCGAFILKLTMTGKTHSVRLSGAYFMKDKSLVRRVRYILAAVVRKVPSPFHEDELHNLEVNS